MESCWKNEIPESTSFPSGHATLAFATATALALDYKKWYVVVPAYLWDQWVIQECISANIIQAICLVA